MGLLPEMMHPVLDGIRRAREDAPATLSGEGDLPASHSITSSARARSVGGIGRSRAFAVFRLMTRCNRVGCSNGISLGFAPFRIWSTK